MSPLAIRKLAFECAIRFSISIPAVWNEKQIAGADWLSTFLKRNKDIAVRTPESTSIARATAFNKYNVAAFFFFLFFSLASGSGDGGCNVSIIACKFVDNSR